MGNNNFNEALNYLEIIYRAACYLTHQTVEAEDLVQEVYLRAYANWDKFKPGTDCKAWLFKILHNTHINRAKREAHKPVALEPEKMEQMPVTITTPAVELKKIVEELLGDEVKEALQKLIPEYREPAILVWLGGFTYAETAEILEHPMGTVMSRLHRARLLLRKSLAEYKKGNP